MKPKPDEDLSKLLILLQCCHSILGTVWPRPGCPQLAGAKGFISTNLFAGLESAVTEVDQLISGLSGSVATQSWLRLWHSCQSVIKQLKALGRSSKNTHIDSAFNLLFLATGVLYHELAQKVPNVGTQDSRFATVRPVDELVQVCQWRGANAAVLTELSNSLADSFERLQW